MNLKQSKDMGGSLKQKAIKPVEVEKKTLEQHKSYFQEWLNKKADWIELLKKLAEHPRGFSFTEPITPNYTNANEANYKWQWDEYAVDLDSFLEMGANFVAAVAASPFDLSMARDLLIFSEEKGHLLHTAAVLWLEHAEGAFDNHAWARYVDKNKKSHVKLEARRALEAARGSNGQPPSLRDYEEVLKRVYMDELEKWHSEWQEKEKPARRSAMYQYLTGMVPADTPYPDDKRNPVAQKRLKARRDLSHLTLGKVHVHRKTQAHDGPQPVRTHPGFWGLYSLSPFFQDDRGRFTAEENKSDLAWVNHAIDANGPLKMAKKNLSHFLTDKEFQVYEKVPRLFADTALTKPGVYLHRSKAHGRDDFLAAVWGTQAKDRKCMVFCTKGVGGDKDLVPSTTAGDKVAFQTRFGTNWTNPKNDAQRTQFAFAYPAVDTDMGAGSWRNLGFCLQSGAKSIKGKDKVWEMEIEVASVDFRNFEMMYKKAVAHRLKDIANGFVQPYIVIEISRLERNRVRMPSIQAGVDRGEIGYPVQVVTLSPIETSLRMTKNLPTDSQNYDYDNVNLEVMELQRVYANSPPLSEATLLAIEADVTKLREYHTGAVTNAVTNGHATEADKQLIEPAMVKVRERMQLAMKIMRNAVASYLVFINNGHSSDSYTSSFAGRNFASGPRDSNDWNLLCLMGKSEMRAKVDMQDLKGFLNLRIPTFLTMLGLAKLEDEPYLVVPATADYPMLWAPWLLDSMAYESHIAECLTAGATLLNGMLKVPGNLLATMKNEQAYANKAADDKDLNAEFTNRLYAEYQQKLTNLQGNKLNKDWLLPLFEV